MANWSNPILTTQYDVFLAEVKERTVDAATMFLNAPSNQPTGSIKLLRAPIKFQEWSGAAWVDKILDVTGGGTGGATAAAARTALGIGTMGVQNSNAISVTGGSIQDITTFHPGTSLLPNTDNSFDIGSFANQWRKGYFKSALVLPVGVDKYAVS